MARKPVLEGGKKEEILSAALQLFLENGYDGTSIRMILEQVGGEVGMFYHYFSSKQEVFDKAFELFMTQQREKFSLMISKTTENMTIREILEQLGDYYESGMSDYAVFSSGAIHWSVLAAVHELTLDTMLPFARTMIIEILQAAGNNDFSDSEWLASFVLRGISGLLHNQSFAELKKEDRLDIIENLFCRVLQVPSSVFNEQEDF